MPVVIDEERGGVAAGNPTRLDVDTLNSGGQIASRSAGSGAGDVFINGKWAVNASLLYQLPWKLEVAASLFYKQGTPYPVLHQTMALGLDGTQRVLVTPEVDSERLDTLCQPGPAAREEHQGRGQQHHAHRGRVQRVQLATPS